MGLIILNYHIFLICLLLVICFFCTDIRAEESRLDGLVVQYRRLFPFNLCLRGLELDIDLAISFPPKLVNSLSLNILKL